MTMKSTGQQLIAMANNGERVPRATILTNCFLVMRRGDFRVDILTPLIFVMYTKPENAATVRVQGEGGQHLALKACKLMWLDGQGIQVGLAVICS